MPLSPTPQRTAFYLVLADLSEANAVARGRLINH